MSEFNFELIVTLDRSRFFLFFCFFIASLLLHLCYSLIPQKRRSGRSSADQLQGFSHRTTICCTAIRSRWANVVVS